MSPLADGELMDSVYLYDKYGSPISYDLWTHLRKLINWVVDHWRLTDEGNTLLRLGEDSIEVTTPVWPEDPDFADDLRDFVSALLLIESARSIKEAIGN